MIALSGPPMRGRKGSGRLRGMGKQEECDWGWRIGETMGELKHAEPAKLFCGIIAVDEDAVARARSELEKHIGEIDIESESMPFDFTDYYREEMGDNLARKFVSFRELIAPDRIVDVKLLTNDIERSNKSSGDGPARRRMNLDPGYATPAKVVLATTKDFSHRIYLRDGIYAEVTMNFRKDGFRYFDWTYPDFRSGRYDGFFKQVRDRTMKRPA